jgi:hypothetical protein
LLTGPKVESVFDRRSYRKGMDGNNAEMKCLDSNGDAFHPEWSYTI